MYVVKRGAVVPRLLRFLTHRHMVTGEADLEVTGLHTQVMERECWGWGGPAAPY